MEFVLLDISFLVHVDVIPSACVSIKLNGIAFSQKKKKKKKKKVKKKKEEKKKQWNYNSHMKRREKNDPMMVSLPTSYNLLTSFELSCTNSFPSLIA